MEGSTGKDDEKDGLMSSVLENDQQTIEEGKVIEESMNKGLGAFTPDMMMANMVKDFRQAKKLYGDTIIRAATGEDMGYLERNMNIPEFRKQLEKKIKEKIDSMKDKGLLDKEGKVTDKGVELASLVLYASEIDIITPIGIRGERIHKEKHIYGGKGDSHPYKKGERFKDVNVKKSIKTALRRGHTKLQLEDLKVYQRMAKGEVTMIYAIDASGSMKGDKIGTCKKAGVALSWKAIQSKDKVGVVVFGEEIIDAVYPTKDFGLLLNALTKIKPASETDIANAIDKSIEMFPKEGTKHLLLLTDGIPTAGEKPEEETMQAVSKAACAGITISMVGINLDDSGKDLAEKIVEVGKGKLYVISNLDEVDRVVLQDYYGIA